MTELGIRVWLKPKILQVRLLPAVSMNMVLIFLGSVLGYVLIYISYLSAADKSTTAVFLWSVAGVVGTTLGTYVYKHLFK